MDNKFDVFLSYDSGDVEWAERLYTALKGRGLLVWVDFAEIQAGDRWAQRLETGLKSSRSFALIVTRRTFQSRWVQDEYFSALTLDMRIVPLLVESDELPVFLKIRQWADLRQPQSFDQCLEKLCQDLVAARSNEVILVEKEPSSQVTTKAELGYLWRERRREAQTVREMWIIRVVSSIIGFLIYLWLADWELIPRGFTLALGNTFVTGMIGWGATVQRLTAAKSNESILTFLLEGLELCQGRREPPCDKLQNEFWQVVHRNTGLPIR